ncbi:MAG TPA: TIGR02996 domain-containing protein [Gemmata sp.]|nr:TIGR02996 domain-containing protein [Gemmata sp.]
MFDAPPRPELLALLAAVKAEPDDDTAKLVLADWLQEQDNEADRARGEFVRKSLHYQRMNADDPARADVIACLDELWQQHSVTWLGPLTDAGFRFPGRESRSWLLFPTIDGAELDASSAARVPRTEAYAWVGGLKFDHLSDTDLWAFMAGPFSGGHISLAFEECHINPLALRVLAMSRKSRNMKSLEITRIFMRPDALRRPRNLAGLRTLRLTHTEIGDAGFKDLCDSLHLKELCSLTVLNDSLSIHSARAFADAIGLPALTELNIGGTNHIGPDGTLILVHKPSAGRLRKLNLWSNGIADYGVEAICRQPHMCNLTHLDVSGNLLTNRSGVAIAAAQHLKTLEELNLRTNNINEEGAMALADSPHLANLRRLDLSGNPVGEKATIHLRHRFGSRVVLD